VETVDGCAEEVFAGGVEGESAADVLEDKTISLGMLRRKNGRLYVLENRWTVLGKSVPAFCQEQ
jgi:hypothetical protein